MPDDHPISPPMHETILPVRAFGVTSHVLRGDDGLYLIDGGFVGGRKAIHRAVALRGWHHLPIRGILVTHGHLDHILNISQLAAESGAWVAAPRLDAGRYQGRYQYEGLGSVGEALEKVAGTMLNYRPFRVDRWLDDLSEIPVWHGLTAIHLPGHTEGHMGFYCASLRLLFCGDLFASYRRLSHLPPAIFNSHPGAIKSSLERALSLDLDGVFPNHGDRADPAEHLARFRRLAKARID
jgi:glyoxylase-like metal-dependent hydrolase (beta-lactamase superfamily II)